jgi:class 3 adenylate cyclase
MGLHTGEPHMGDEGYLGLDVVRAARISEAGHGGQILISETTRALLGNQLPEGESPSTTSGSST